MASHKPVSDGPSRYDELIAALLRPQDVRGLTLKGLHLIMAMRVCAMFEASGRDPVPDLAQRYQIGRAHV